MKILITLILSLLLSILLISQDLSWRHHNIDYPIQAKPGKGYLLMTNTRSASFILPSNPSEGDMTGFLDVSGTFGQNEVLVNPGNNLINGTSGTQTYDAQDDVVVFIWSNSPYGWKQYYSAKSAVHSGTSSFIANVVADYGAIGNGSTDDASAFTAAFSANTDVFVPSSVNPYKISTLVIPEGKRIWFESGAVLDITNALTINGEIVAGQSRIFTRSSASYIDARNAKIDKAHVEWFGAKGDGTGTFDAEAIEKTLEVFCQPSLYKEYIKERNDTAYIYQNGTKAVAHGALYNIEQTIDFPRFGSLEIGRQTFFLGVTDFYDSYIEIARKPAYIDGGVLLIRHFSEMDGWSTDVQDTNLKYAYNKNPVINIYLDTENSNTKWRYDNAVYRHSSLVIENMQIKPTQYPAQLDRQALLYDAIFIQADTTHIFTGTDFELYNAYKIIDYVAGDDFTNVGGTNVDGNTFHATGTTPADWTNGSTVRKTYNASYGDVIRNVDIYKSDTGLYINGDPINNHGMINSVTVTGCYFDGCIGGAVVLGRNSAGNVVTDNMYQVYTNQTYGIYPTLDIGSSYNYFSGTMWDVHLDSTVVIRDNTGGNRIESHGIASLSERFTKYEGGTSDKIFNPVGDHPSFEVFTEGGTYGDYTLKGRHMNIFPTYGNDSMYHAHTDANIANGLEVVAGRDDSYKPAVYIETQNKLAGSGNFTTHGFNGYQESIRLKNYNVQGIQPSTGMGHKIGWYVNNNEDEVSDEWMGSFGLRLAATTTSTTKALAQIWLNNAGVDFNAATFMPDSTYFGSNVTADGQAILIRNIGASGGAEYGMYEANGGGFWKFKAVDGGDFKIRDHTNGLDVVYVEANSESQVVYIGADGSTKIGYDFLIPNTTVPTSATATGTQGMVAIDSDYIYICTATNTWKRTAISTW